VHSPLGGAGFEMLIEAESFAGGTKERQKSHRESIQQPQAIAALRRIDVDLCHAHAKMRILGIAEGAFDAPPFGVFF
jgi:hypothetical protein